ncbi:MAG: YfbU family protein [Acidobacteria bacterium]|nr:YfbU family protein [Acidobacteriota bacterium]
MKLSRTERWILSNQFRILEALYPNEAEDFADAREIVERGYELHYDWITQYISEDVMKADESSEVIKILSMFRALKYSFKALDNKSGIEEWQIDFAGFDGNSEGKQMVYAKYFCNSEGGKFTELNIGDDFNSHCPTIDRYRRMLAEWEKSSDRNKLMREDILRIISA